MQFSGACSFRVLQLSERDPKEINGCYKCAVHIIGVP